MDRLTESTKLLDYDHQSIRALNDSRGWNRLDDHGKILGIYNFVRDEIRFGFNEADDMPASAILKDGYGQCNTKSILFMALLRSVGVSCRLHGFTVTSDLQKGALSGPFYSLRPKELIHTWVEVLYRGKWMNIEGFILDKDYLRAVQLENKDCTGGFCGFGVAIADLQNPQIDWEENDTYIQKDGIRKDFGVFDDPDAFFKNHGQFLSPLKKFLYKNLGRHAMNGNIARLRKKNRKD